MTEPASRAAPSPSPIAHGAALPFRTVLHADWSRSAEKRWVAAAVRADMGWRVGSPRPVGDLPTFKDELWDGEAPLLAGFDFPIGLPEAYGRFIGLPDFPTALMRFGAGEWSEFFDVAETPGQISLRRPFYPRVSSAAAARRHLVEALGLDDPAALFRRCERATIDRRAACPLFWTLGGNQVGKAAISGWREVIVPARRRGARLWPFDGELAALASSEVPVLAETYPAEACRQVGVAFRSGMSKRRQDDRRAAAAALPAWAERHGVAFDVALVERIRDGFGAGPSGEDAFDALVGLLGMLEIVDARRPARPASQDPAERWEGWILGQAA